MVEFVFRLDFPIPLDALYCRSEGKGAGSSLPTHLGFFRHPAVGLALSESKSIFSIPGHVIT